MSEERGEKKERKEGRRLRRRVGLTPSAVLAGLRQRWEGGERGGGGVEAMIKVMLGYSSKKRGVRSKMDERQFRIKGGGGRRVEVGRQGRVRFERCSLVNTHFAGKSSE